MEAAKTLAPDRQPALSFDDDPAWLLRGVNFMDPADPLDRQLIEYKKIIAAEELPTAVEQRRMVAGLRRGRLASARELVARHTGLIAAAAYPFKGDKLSSDELLRSGVHAFLQAAKRYDLTTGEDFSDYAAAAVHGSLASSMPEMAGDSFIELPQNPMEGVYQFMETVQPATNGRHHEFIARRTREREQRQLTAEESQVWGLLHLKADDIRDRLGFSSSYKVESTLSSLKKKLDVETREAAALQGLEAGISYDLVEIPAREEFTVRERLVATRLGKRNAEIAEELGMSRTMVIEIGAALRAKTHARTRAEIALLAHTHDFEPTEEEMNPSLAERLTPRQRTIVQRILYMQDKEVATDPELEISEHGVDTMVNRLMAKAGLAHNSRTGLILELHRQGMEFEELTEPIEPLSETLYDYELQIAKRLHLPYETIIDELDLDCTVERLGEMVYQARKKVGARTRQELALMVDVFSDEAEAMEKNFDNNQWRLARLLGVKTLAACDLDDLLSVASDKERETISAYYLTDKPVTWRQVSHEMGHRDVRSTAQRGVQKILRHLQDEASQLVH